jgi:hypothetical protein
MERPFNPFDDYLQRALDEAGAQHQQVCGWGFEPTEFGEYSASDCSVILYEVEGVWQIDILTPTRTLLSCEVPLEALAPRTPADLCAEAAVREASVVDRGRTGSPWET